MQTLVTHVTIQPTSLTAPFLQKRDQHGDVVTIPPPKYTVTKIIKNDKFEAGTSELRVLMGTLDVDASPAYRAYGKAIDSQNTNGLAEKSKFMALFAFDPFTDSWKLTYFDLADATSDFNGRGVEGWLISHQARRVGE